MPTYQLIYFNGRDRAEIARLMFAQAGVKYEDKRVTEEEWVEMKPGEFHFRTLYFHGHPLHVQATSTSLVL